MSQTETTTHEEAEVGIHQDTHDANNTTESVIHTSTEIHEPLDGDLLGRFGLNAPLFIGQLINFVIVLLVLWRFAYKPLLKLMEDRTKKIEKGLQQADEMEQRIADLENEKENVLSAARSEAKNIVSQASELAETRRTEAIANAKNEVEKVVSAGKTQLAAQKEQMIADAKEELVALVVEAVKKVAEGSVDMKKAESEAAAAIEKASQDI